MRVCLAGATGGVGRCLAAACIRLGQFGRYCGRARVIGWSRFLRRELAGAEDRCLGRAGLVDLVQQQPRGSRFGLGLL